MRVTSEQYDKYEKEMAEAEVMKKARLAALGSQIDETNVKLLVDNEAIEFFIDNGTNINSVDKQNNSLLLVACMYSKPETIILTSAGISDLTKTFSEKYSDHYPILSRINW